MADAPSRSDPNVRSAIQATKLRIVQLAAHQQAAQNLRDSLEAQLSALDQNLVRSVPVVGYPPAK